MPGQEADADSVADAEASIVAPAEERILQLAEPASRAVQDAQQPAAAPDAGAPVEQAECQPSIAALERPSAGGHVESGSLAEVNDKREVSISVRCESRPGDMPRHQVDPYKQALHASTGQALVFMKEQVSTACRIIA